MFERAKFNSVGLIALTLSACGGGGGGVGSTPVARTPPAALPNPMPKPVTSPSNEIFDTSEYRNSSAAIGSNAIGAWQAGATGRGVTLGFVDSGIVPTLSDFESRIHPRSRDVNGDRPMNDVWGHGTAIAGIAAAARDNQGMQGIAYEATIFMARADEDCPESCTFPTDAVADGIDAARAAGATVINLSIRGDSSNVRNAVQRAVNAGIIVVIGAGNGGSQPSELARELVSIAPHQVIIVGGLGRSNPDGTINYDVPSIYTSAAGSSLNSFLMAPGWLNHASYFRTEGSFDRLSGTSFSAPVVTGAIALIAQAFPTLTPQQIVQLLYMSADDLGAPGPDATFGRGRLNIGRAFLPIGPVHMANTMAPPPKSLGTLPTAAGDAGRRGSLKATVLDIFERPFAYDLATGLGERREAGPLARSSITGQQNAFTMIGPVGLAYTVDAASAASPRVKQLGLSRDEQGAARLLAATAIARLTDRSSIAFAFGTGSSNLRDQIAKWPANSFLLSESTSRNVGFGAVRVNALVYRHKLANWQLAVAGEKGSIAVGRREPNAPYSQVSWSAERAHSSGRVRLGADWLVEARTVLGGTFNSMFGEGASHTWFANFEAEQKVGHDWLITAAYRRGWTSFPGGRMTTSGMSLDVSKRGLFDKDDSLVFRLSQPLRVERGAIALTLPINWDHLSRRATEGRRSLSLTPSGRELFAETGYLRSLRNGSFGLHGYVRHEPDHVRASERDVGVAIRARMRF